MIKKSKTLVWAAGICLVLFSSSVIAPETYLSFFKNFTQQSLDTFGDFYLYFGLTIFVILLLLALFPTGRIKLGKSKPSYSRYAWIAMLFSTGMGPGMMLRAVQEPVYYFANPPNALGYEPVSYALSYTFFHWGFTPWAMYGLFGLIIAYFMYLRGKTLLPSDSLGTNKSLKPVVDAFMIVCTLIGVISSLGLGSKQLLGGVSFLSNLELPSYGTLLIVATITSIAIYSARSGLSKSIKVISTLNLSVMLFLMIFVILNSDLQAFGHHLIDAFGIYIKDFVPISLNIGKYEVDRSFLMDWTYFYWAFWLAWVPFTGVFISRISKGRSIREFVLGTLLAPSIGTFFWFTAFGQKAMNSKLAPEVLSEKYGSIYSAIFLFFENLPFDSIINPLAILLIFTFLITSVDSAIYVLSMFSDEGKSKPSRVHRMVWGVCLGSLAIGLVYASQGTLLEATSFVLISFALPFSALYIILIIVFLRNLYRTYFINDSSTTTL